jgi:peroxiredoxin
VTVSAKFVFNLGGYSEPLSRQADGRYRSHGLMPDHEYMIVAASRDYVPTAVPRINLPEGGSSDLTVTLRRRPMPPETGKLAPPFSVRTLDGTPLSLQGLRGRFVLLHFWAPNPANHGLNDLMNLKVVAEQFGKDDRFVMISFCLVNDPEVAARIIKASEMSWHHVVLRDHGLDPIALNYQAFPAPRSFLIGRDGRIIAKNLVGDQIDRSVTEALGRK